MNGLQMIVGMILTTIVILALVYNQGIHYNERNIREAYSLPQIGAKPIGGSAANILRELPQDATPAMSDPQV